MKYDYSVHVVWSKDDQAYLAAIDELPGCIADGATPEEALSNVRIIAQEWVETAKLEKRPIPRPRSLEDCDEANRKFQADLQNHIQSTVTGLVTEIVGKLAQQEDGPMGRFSGGRSIRAIAPAKLTSVKK